MMHRLPLFVLLPGKSSRRTRSLKLGWVCDFDDETDSFLIIFSDNQPELKRQGGTKREMNLGKPRSVGVVRYLGVAIQDRRLVR